MSSGRKALPATAFSTAGIKTRRRTFSLASITINASGIHSSSGPSIAFNRDADNRITQIIGPTGTVTYTYSSVGDLASVQYPNGATQSYSYDADHDLLSISGGGHIVRTLTYDSSGRITAVTDGNYMGKGAPINGVTNMTNFTLTIYMFGNDMM